MCHVLQHGGTVAEPQGCPLLRCVAMLPFSCYRSVLNSSSGSDSATQRGCRVSESRGTRRCPFQERLRSRNHDSPVQISPRLGLACDVDNWRSHDQSCGQADSGIPTVWTRSHKKDPNIKVRSPVEIYIRTCLRFGAVNFVSKSCMANVICKVPLYTYMLGDLS